MILQILPDAGPVEDHRNAMLLLQLRGRADTREHQKLDRAERPGREDHLSLRTRGFRDAVLPPAHAARARAIEVDLLGEAIRLQPQVLTIEHRLQESTRRRPAPSGLLVDVKIS
jgi:hypothetical protein